MGKNKASLMLLLVGFYRFYTGTFQNLIKQEKDNCFARKLENEYFNIKMGCSCSVRT